MSFRTTDDFRKFSRSVQGESRFCLAPDAQEFLSTLGETLVGRAVTLAKGKTLWRAQLGYCEELPTAENGHSSHTYPFGKTRMLPTSEFAKHNRASAQGIPFLYLASDKETAMAELRPGLHDMLSCAVGQIVDDLDLIDCSERAGKHPYPMSATALENGQLHEPLSEDQITTAIWTDIDNAFSKPVSPNDSTLDYLPTQWLADFFRSKGFHGVGYKSKYGEGYNVVLFDRTQVNFIGGQVFSVEEINYRFIGSSAPIGFK
jgi:RES domain